MQAVEIEVTTVEDAWAVRLIDMMTSLHQLQVEGTTREMYIWGNVQVCFAASYDAVTISYAGLARQQHKSPAKCHYMIRSRASANTDCLGSFAQYTIFACSISSKSVLPSMHLSVFCFNDLIHSSTGGCCLHLALLILKLL